MRKIDGDAVKENIIRAHCEGCDNLNGRMCRKCAVMDCLEWIDDAEEVEDD